MTTWNKLVVNNIITDLFFSPEGVDRVCQLVRKTSEYGNRYI